jgi:alkylhydroperoxidase family enzyme
MSDRHAEPFERLRAAALEGRGELDPKVRTAIADERAVGAVPPILPVLLPYLEKVAYQAYTITDEDVEALKKAGLTEDKIFEATVAAAVGAGLKRLKLGLAALSKE